MKARFALVGMASKRIGGHPHVMAIPEDLIPLAESHYWVVLGRDSEVLKSVFIQEPKGGKQSE